MYSEPIGVLIADDHTVVRTGIRTVFEADPHFTIIGEAATVADTVLAVARSRPALVVLDLHMAGENALPLIALLRQGGDGAAVLVLTMHDDPAYVSRALALGAGAFIRKDDPERELLTAARAVAAGHTYVTPNLGAPVAGTATAPPPPVTERQRQVLHRVVKGLTNRRIAKDLRVSIRTVETERSQLRRALAATNDAQMILHARSSGLLFD